MQLMKQKWLPVSYKRHQVGHLDLLGVSAVNRQAVGSNPTLPGEPTSDFSAISMTREHSVLRAEGLPGRLQGPQKALQGIN